MCYEKATHQKKKKKGSDESGNINTDVLSVEPCQYVSRINQKFYLVPP